MQRTRVERVLSAFRGSSWPVLAETSDGRKLIVKLRGTAQGLLPLVAELVVGELADALGLATPARCVVELDSQVASDDPHEELLDLLARSAGLNLGLSWLEGCAVSVWSVAQARAARDDIPSASKLHSRVTFSSNGNSSGLTGSPSSKCGCVASVSGTGSQAPVVRFFA